MPGRRGLCRNYGNCPTRADTREVIEVPEGKEFVCPDCGSPLVPEEEAMHRPRRRKRPGAVLFLLLPLLVVGGTVLWLFLRGHPQPAPTPASQSPPASREVPPANERTLFTISGSRILGEKLVPGLVKAFFSDELRAEAVAVRREKDGRSLAIVGKVPNGEEAIAVRIVCSSTSDGWRDLAGDGAQIAMAFRKITSEEAAPFGKTVNLTAPDSEHVIGVSGVVAVVSAANPLSKLSLAELRRVFGGSVADGQAVGFPPGKIVLYASPVASGIWQLFAQHVLEGSSGSADIVRLENGAEISSRVAADAHALGIVDLPHVGSCKALALYEKGTLPLAPTFASLESESYLLSTRLYLYTKGSGRNPDVDAFIQFVLSDRGQQGVQEAGFVGAATKSPKGAESLIQPEMAIPRDAPTAYRHLVQGGNRVAFDVRFRTGSAELDNKALVDIRRLAKLMGEREEKSQAVLLIGFTDNVGDRAYNLRLSVERAQSVGQALRVLGIPVAATAGEGDQMPVASNDSPEGREKNRRVELWIVRGKASEKP
ncbi:phosphate ABC transporter substrate-binding/OmpA family protein [Methylacidimicrobium sp. B4]|uniref:phosphate ABC transporter substrate-binding/OmpA family protein n=1 Tax=Methylacidimicrobium sp. B4 TaxID=2796139 RepID=UPI001A8DAB47|nr:phosphate ABC transporter substrate-binding/OmpA family protein [Methylacidimicrobium sp. B4]QSR84210.1 OmpA family protein [Methylacidimicrobium sp. B4]